METSVVNESVLVSSTMLTQLHSPSKALHTQLDSFNLDKFYRSLIPREYYLGILHILPSRALCGRGPPHS